MRIFSKTVVSALLLCGSSFVLPTQAAAWQLLGKKTVTDRLDRDVVAVPGAQRFSKIRICVSRNPVRFYDVKVRFANGGRQDVRVARRIAPGNCTRAIDLRGPRRNISSVTFLYEETSLRLRRATVRVYGR